MKKVILDTSFILSCVRNKIDFFEKIQGEGYHILIPQQTIKELEGLRETLSLKILEKNKFDLVNLPGKDADSAIIKFARLHPSAIIATLDKALAKEIKNRKLIIRGIKKLEVI